MRKRKRDRERETLLCKQSFGIYSCELSGVHSEIFGNASYSGRLLNCPWIFMKMTNLFLLLLTFVSVLIYLSFFS